MQSIDFVLVFPQAPVKTDIYMKPPNVSKEFEITDLPNFNNRFIYVYKLIKILYGLNNSGKTWYDYPKNSLIKWGWHQLSIYECLFTNNEVILVIYVNDAILMSPLKQNISYERTSLMKDYGLTDKG